MNVVPNGTPQDVMHRVYEWAAISAEQVVSPLVQATGLRHLVLESFRMKHYPAPTTDRLPATWPGRELPRFVFVIDNRGARSIVYSEYDWLVRLVARSLHAQPNDDAEVQNVVKFAAEHNMSVIVTFILPATLHADDAYWEIRTFACDDENQTIIDGQHQYACKYKDGAGPVGSTNLASQMIHGDTNLCETTNFCRVMQHAMVDIDVYVSAEEATGGGEDDEMTYSSNRAELTKIVNQHYARTKEDGNTIAELRAALERKGVELREALESKDIECSARLASVHDGYRNKSELQRQMLDQKIASAQASDALVAKTSKELRDEREKSGALVKSLTERNAELKALSEARGLEIKACRQKEADEKKDQLSVQNKKVQVAKFQKAADEALNNYRKAVEASSKAAVDLRNAHVKIESLESQRKTFEKGMEMYKEKLAESKEDLEAMSTELGKAHGKLSMAAEMEKSSATDARHAQERSQGLLQDVQRLQSMLESKDLHMSRLEQNISTLQASVESGKQCDCNTQCVSSQTEPFYDEKLAESECAYGRLVTEMEVVHHVYRAEMLSIEKHGNGKQPLPATADQPSFSPALTADHPQSHSEGAVWTGMYDNGGPMPHAHYASDFPTFSTGERAINVALKDVHISIANLESYARYGARWEQEAVRLRAQLDFVTGGTPHPLSAAAAGLMFDNDNNAPAFMPSVHFSSYPQQHPAHAGKGAGFNVRRHLRAGGKGRGSGDSRNHA